MESKKSDLESLVEQFSSREIPPVNDWCPSTERDIDMRIDRQGGWYYQGSPIQRERMVALFSTILRRDGEDYFLVTPQEKLRIVVDNAPFVALLMTASGTNDKNRLLTFTDNVGNVFSANADHPVWVENCEDQTLPYVLVRDSLPALLARSVYYQMADLATEVKGVTGVWSGGVFFPLQGQDG